MQAVQFLTITPMSLFMYGQYTTSLPQHLHFSIVHTGMFAVRNIYLQQVTAAQRSKNFTSNTMLCYLLYYNAITSN